MSATKEYCMDIMEQPEYKIGEELAKANELAAKVKAKKCESKSCRMILSELESQIKEVDFRKIAGLDEEKKISQKTYVVHSVEEVLRIAAVNDWGLCIRNGYIYIFNGKYWKVIDAVDFRSFLSKAALKMGVPKLDAKYHQFREELFKQFLSVGNLSTPEAGKSILINLLNGTFEISTDKQQLREPKREDFLKYQLPFEYNPEVGCPLFNKYLLRVLPDEDCRKILAEYIGYIFVNDLKLEKAVILYGSGANGKSVFFEIVNAILGRENICSYSLQNLTKSDSYQRAELSNKLLNYASEINGKLEASVFKQLVSGEPVEARQIYGKPFIMDNYAKLMFNCNELPHEVEQTDAFFRRFIIIPFTQTIPEEEQDPELAKKIINEELSGVFNWLLAGLKRIVIQKKFTQSALVKEQVETFRTETDNVALYMREEEYKKSVTGKFVTLKFLFDEYRKFCNANGYRACANRKFSERLRALGFETKKTMNGVVVYVEK